MKVYIPFHGQTLGVSSQQAQNRLININPASLTDLDSLPGVGQVTAQKIIDERPYQDLSDLYTKKIVSKSTFDKISLDWWPNLQL